MVVYIRSKVDMDAAAVRSMYVQNNLMKRVVSTVHFRPWLGDVLGLLGKLPLAGKGKSICRLGRVSHRKCSAHSANISTRACMVVYNNIEPSADGWLQETLRRGRYVHVKLSMMLPQAQFVQPNLAWSMHPLCPKVPCCPRHPVIFNLPRKHRLSPLMFYSITGTLLCSRNQKVGMKSCRPR